MCKHHHLEYELEIARAHAVDAHFQTSRGLSLNLFITSGGARGLEYPRRVGFVSFVRRRRRTPYVPPPPRRAAPRVHSPVVEGVYVDDDSDDASSSPSSSSYTPKEIDPSTRNQFACRRPPATFPLVRQLPTTCRARVLRRRVRVFATQWNVAKKHKHG